jgi:hypothetical protein
MINKIFLKYFEISCFITIIVAIGRYKDNIQNVFEETAYDIQYLDFSAVPIIINVKQEKSKE